MYNKTAFVRRKINFNSWNVVRLSLTLDIGRPEFLVTIRWIQ